MSKEVKVQATTVQTSVEALMWSGRSSMNAYEVTVERLSAAIKMSLYRPGDQLPTERELADLMRVSRTTLREAIRVLVVQGFLTVKRGRTGGTFVAETLTLPNVRDLKQHLQRKGTTLSDILDHRLVVEPGVSAIAAQRATSKQIEAMQTLVDQMPGVVDQFSEHRRLDTEFHLSIARATQSDRLASIVASIHAELSDLLAVIPHSSAACLDSAIQHQQILAAIKAEQPETARSLMTEHLVRTNSLLNGLLG